MSSELLQNTALNKWWSSILLESIWPFNSKPRRNSKTPLSGWEEWRFKTTTLLYFCGIMTQWQSARCLVESVSDTSQIFKEETNRLRRFSSTKISATFLLGQTTVPFIYIISFQKSVIYIHLRPILKPSQL